ncbi:universal stress protein [Acidianus sulfidivorans JP7]|uniref:Universal stress protein n=1 Tax=Acidianus sulfidivorans JP7 TaxID=619593 RepID=A0A2U9IL42_9CREN|nr:universal stress protein [Acidianus sulfidivorans]AWR96759.1 universal stress protein [Acidianus sulfidivorans JP7]
MYKKILVGFDGSHHSMKALLHALNLAKTHPAEIVAVEAIETPGDYVIEGYFHEDHIKIKEKIAMHTEQIKRLSAEHGINIKYKVARGPPAEVISKFAEIEDVDLIVLGTRGLRGLKKLVLGSVSSAVSEKAKKPVMIIK